MINRIVLVGRVVADPEERQTNEGTVISKFRIAVDRIPRGRDRDREKEADFFNVVVFGRTAEFCNKYLGRGDLVGVDGRCQVDQYTNREGQRQIWIEVNADSVQKYSWSDDRGGGGGGGGRRDDRDRERSQPERDGERRGGRWDHTPDDFGDEEAAAKPPAEGQEGRRQTFDKPADDLYEDDDDDPFAEE